MPNKLVMLSTHGTWDPLVENPILLKTDGTSLTGSTLSVGEHRVNPTLFWYFDTAIEKTYDEMQITTGDNIYIGYDGDGIQGWDHLNRQDVNTTIPVPPTILLLKFISKLLIEDIPVAKIFLIQCQNTYISSFIDLTICITSENLRKMGFPEEEANTKSHISQIVKVLTSPKNINIIHTDEDKKDMTISDMKMGLQKALLSLKKTPPSNPNITDKDLLKIRTGEIKQLEILTKILTRSSSYTHNKYIYRKHSPLLLGTTIVIPVKQGKDLYGGIYADDIGGFYPVASTAGWQKFLNNPVKFYKAEEEEEEEEEEEVKLPPFDMMRYLPVWIKSVVPPLKPGEIEKPDENIITLNIKDNITVIHTDIRTIEGLIMKGGSRKKTKRKPKRTKKLKPSKRKSSKRKLTKRKPTKRKLSKRKPTKRKPSKRKPSKRKPSKRSRVRKNKQSLKKMKGGGYKKK
jgi:hypothetical protein